MVSHIGMSLNILMFRTVMCLGGRDLLVRSGIKNAEHSITCRDSEKRAGRGKGSRVNRLAQVMRERSGSLLNVRDSRITRVEVTRSGGRVVLAYAEARG